MLDPNTIPVPEHGIPQSVLSKAWQLGLHNDCLVAGAEHTCPQCLDNIFLAFEWRYGSHLSVPELISAIASEFASEEEARIDGR